MSVGTIYETAYKGDFSQVKVKIDADASLILAPDTSSRLLIHWAALGGNDHLVGYLVDVGSPVDCIDDTNCTPLILASSAGRLEVVRLLIGKGANVNHKTVRGQSSLHYACSKGHKEVAKFLLNCDANINETDILGATPLHRAAAQGRADIVEILLKSPDIKLDLCDSTGSTPLHLSCEEDREMVACTLLKAGASLDVKNKEGKRPIDLCLDKLQKSLINILD